MSEHERTQLERDEAEYGVAFVRRLPLSRFHFERVDPNKVFTADGGYVDNDGNPVQAWKSEVTTT